MAEKMEPPANGDDKSKIEDGASKTRRVRVKEIGTNLQAESLQKKRRPRKKTPLVETPPAGGETNIPPADTITDTTEGQVAAEQKRTQANSDVKKEPDLNKALGFYPYIDSHKTPTNPWAYAVVTAALIFAAIGAYKWNNYLDKKMSAKNPVKQEQTMKRTEKDVSKMKSEKIQKINEFINNKNIKDTKIEIVTSPNELEDWKYSISKHIAVKVPNGTFKVISGQPSIQETDENGKPLYHYSIYIKRVVSTPSANAAVAAVAKIQVPIKPVEQPKETKPVEQAKAKAENPASGIMCHVGALNIALEVHNDICARQGYTQKDKCGEKLKQVEKSIHVSLENITKGVEAQWKTNPGEGIKAISEAVSKLTYWDTKVSKDMAYSLGSLISRSYTSGAHMHEAEALLKSTVKKAGEGISPEVSDVLFYEVIKGMHKCARNGQDSEAIDSAIWGTKQVLEFTYTKDAYSLLRTRAYAMYTLYKLCEWQANKEAKQILSDKNKSTIWKQMIDLYNNNGVVDPVSQEALKMIISRYPQLANIKIPKEPADAKVQLKPQPKQPQFVVRGVFSTPNQIAPKKAEVKPVEAKKVEVKKVEPKKAEVKLSMAKESKPEGQKKGFFSKVKLFFTPSPVAPKEQKSISQEKQAAVKKESKPQQEQKPQTPQAIPKQVPQVKSEVNPVQTVLPAVIPAAVNSNKVPAAEKIMKQVVPIVKEAVKPEEKQKKESTAPQPSQVNTVKSEPPMAEPVKKVEPLSPELEAKYGKYIAEFEKAYKKTDYKTFKTIANFMRQNKPEAKAIFKVINDDEVYFKSIGQSLCESASNADTIKDTIEMLVGPIENGNGNGYNNNGYNGNH